MTRRIAQVPTTRTEVVKCLKCGYDNRVDISFSGIFMCGTPGCSQTIDVRSVALVANPPALAKEEPRPEGLVAARHPTAISTDAEITLTMGPMKFAPVRYHTFDVGPVAITVRAEPGEDGKALGARASAELSVLWRSAFGAAKKDFVAAFESLYGPGSFVKSLNGEAVVTSR